MRAYYATNSGKIRTRNEDAAGVFHRESVTLLALADGMGGHQAGDVASKTAIQCIDIAFASFAVEMEKEDAKRWLGKLFEQINTVIFNEAQKNESLFGMGTTLVAALIHPEYIILGNVGDSRAYVTDNQHRLILVTEDHTLVAELHRQGEISQEELEAHPNKNILLQAIGTEDDIVVDIFELTGGKPNQILLCSDGLTDMLSDAQIAEILSYNLSLEETTQKLIAEANERGGRDNITVVICHLEEAK